MKNGKTISYFFSVLIILGLVAGWYYFTDQDKFDNDDFLEQVEETISQDNEFNLNPSDEEEIDQGSDLVDKEDGQVNLATCGNGICEDMVCMAIGCPEAETIENCPQDCDSNYQVIEETTQMANPSATKCIEDGYIYQNREDEWGNQNGVCIMPDGRECDGWTYYRGECI